MFCITFHIVYVLVTLANVTYRVIRLRYMMFANITHTLLWFSSAVWLDNLNTCVCSQPKGVSSHRHMYDPISDGHNHVRRLEFIMG